MVASCSAFFLMLPWSFFLWMAVPELSTSIQFPHRFCAILTLATAGLVAAAIDRSVDCRNTRRPLTVIISCSLSIVAMGTLTWRADRTWIRGLHKSEAHEVDPTREVDGMYRTYVSGDHLNAFADLLGTEPASYQVKVTPVIEPNATLASGRGLVTMRRRGIRVIVVSSSMDENGSAQIDQVYSPLWKCVGADDQNARLILRSSTTGLTEIPLRSGRHDVELRFDTGWPGRWGVLTTLFSVILIVAGMALELYACVRRRVAYGGQG